jgi:transcriptional regulator with XRE-family HTH domain
MAEEPDFTSLDGRLRYARELAGYPSAAAAADAFGWTYSTYAGHENGSRGIKLGAMRGYAAAFSVSFAWLVEGKGEPRPKGEAMVRDAWQRMRPEDREIYEAMGRQLAERSTKRK